MTRSHRATVHRAEPVCASASPQPVGDRWSRGRVQSAPNDLRVRRSKKRSRCNGAWKLQNVRNVRKESLENLETNLGTSWNIVLPFSKSIELDQFSKGTSARQRSWTQDMWNFGNKDLETLEHWVCFDLETKKWTQVAAVFAIQSTANCSINLPLLFYYFLQFVNSSFSWL